MLSSVSVEKHYKHLTMTGRNTIPYNLSTSFSLRPLRLCGELLSMKYFNPAAF